MLSAPGLRFYRALTPFHQLEVGPAHLAVGGVLGCTPFFRVFSGVLYFIFMFHSIYLYSACPCIPWVPRGVFYAWVMRDVTSDLVPFGVLLLALPGLCLLHGL